MSGRTSEKHGSVAGSEPPVEVRTYIDGFPPEVAARLEQVRAAILAEVSEPVEKMRYGIAAVMLGGRYALHYAGWKKHIGLYPVPRLDEPLESEVAPYRSSKDTVILLHARDLPVAMISRVAAAVVALREPSA